MNQQNNQPPIGFSRTQLFNTRFSYTNNFVLYTQQEAKAFNDKLGIWNEKELRQGYVRQLREEGKPYIHRKTLF